jgi:hypothetical protein
LKDEDKDCEEDCGKYRRVGIAVRWINEVSNPK